MDITVWTTEQQVPEGIASAIVTAVGAFQGKLADIEDEFKRVEGWDSEKERNRLLLELSELQNLTLSIVASGIVGTTDRLRKRLERLDATEKFAKDGRCGLLFYFDHMNDRSAYLWSYRTESGVDLRMYSRVGKNRQASEPVFIQCVDTFDAAYDFVLEHREELMDRLKSLAMECASQAAENTDGSHE